MNAINEVLKRKLRQMSGVDLNATEPCDTHNPVLWALFCARTNRDLTGSMPPVWTEADVVHAFLSDFAMREADLVA